MAINNKRIFFTGFVITGLIFISIMFANSLMNDKREGAVMERMNQVVEEYEEMQNLLIMSEFFGEESTCVALENMLYNMNKGLWDLGKKIDSYREATQEFLKDPFYQEQKRQFNRKQSLYFSIMKRLEDKCEFNQTIVSYFYKKKEYCENCDAVSFVLSDIRNDLENIEKEDELLIFSFDADLDLPSINLLTRFYNITEYPSIVIGDNVYPGLFNKKQLKSVLCEEAELSICP